MAFRSIPRRFHDWIRVRPDGDAYFERRDGIWRPTSWRRFTEEVREAARALIAIGCEPGSTVAIMGFNAPSWTITDLAAMTVGAVPVGVYTSCTPDQVAYILGHARCRVLVLDGEDAWRKVESRRADLPDLETVISMRDVPSGLGPGVLTWPEFLQRGSGVADGEVDRRLDAVTADRMGALIYTSGTTGPPKGSMLSHGALSAATDMGIELLPDPHIGSRLLSYLPMAHAAERALTILGPAAYGYTVYYAESIDAMPSNLREVQPEIFLGVPRVWEKMQAAIEERIARIRGPKGALLRRARRVAFRVHERRCEGGEPGRRLAMRYMLARRLVLDRIRTAVGLGSARVLLSGAAPLSLEVLRFMASLDMPIREVYGQTEVCGPTSNNRPGETRWGSVGRPFRGCEVRVGKDGEIVVRGPHLFSGYFREPEATAEAMAGGWLHTGDLGHMDEDGYLHITGRRKEIIITSGGKNVAPRNVEDAIREHPLVDQVVVVGDRRKYLGALLTMVDSPETAGSHDAHEPSLLHRIWAHVEHVNQRFSPVEQIKRIMVLRERFSVARGELTPTLKVRRMTIQEKYAREIGELYDGEPISGTGVVRQSPDSTPSPTPSE